jgi:hypothetical protein
LFAVAAAGCGQAAPSVDVAAICQQVDARYGRFDDTLAVARAAGADYLDTVARCLQRDPRAMHTLFWLTGHARFDAASSEGNAQVLHDVLRDVGERFYAGCLNAEPAEVRDEVRAALLYDMGWGNVETLKFSEIQALWPKVFPETYDPNRDG